MSPPRSFTCAGASIPLATLSLQSVRIVTAASAIVAVRAGSECDVTNWWRQVAVIRLPMRVNRRTAVASKHITVAETQRV